VTFNVTDHINHSPDICTQINYKTNNAKNENKLRVFDIGFCQGLIFNTACNEPVTETQIYHNSIQCCSL